MLALYVSGATITMQRREVSYDALTDAVASVVGGKPEDEIGGGYVGTAEWRARWWSDIWDDVAAQDMYLTGHGWGDNLAVRYGIVPASAADDPRVLRLPHNIFFSLAGRAGLVVAVAFIAIPVLTIARTFRDGPAPRRSRRLAARSPPPWRPAWWTSTSSPPRAGSCSGA